MSEGESQYPSELNWENMEEGILNRMEELQSESKPQPVKPFPWKRSTLILIGIIIAGISLIPRIYTPLENEAITDSSSISTEPIKVESSNSASNHRNNMNILEVTSANSTTQLENEILGSQVNEKSIVENSNFNSTITSNNNDLRSAKDLQIIPPNDNDLESIGELKIINSNDITKGLQYPNKNSNTFTITKNESTELLESKTTPSSLNENVLLGKPSNTFEEVSFLSIPSIVFPLEKKLNPINLTIKSAVVFEKKKTAPVRFLAMGEVSMWNMGYGNTKPERDEYETAKVSFGTQLNFIKPLKKDFSLMIGLKYQQLESQFEWKNTITNYNLTLVDTIIEIQNNLITGEQTEVRGDIDFVVSADRIIKHYNKVQFFQIPFAIGKTWKLNKKLQADIFVGGSVNISSIHKGRTIYQGEISNYNDISKDIFNSQLRLNGLVNGKLTYNLNDHFGVVTGFEYQRSLMNWSNEENINMFPNVVSWQLGVSYSISK